MRLPDFIERNTESILSEWVAFARKCEGGETMNLDALRDHAAEMLVYIVADLREPQTRREQFQKSQGEAPDNGSSDTAAESHGAGRATVGFTAVDMVAEFRALRASVLRLWPEAQGALSKEDVEDVMRFNESIDQALAESMARFSRNLQQSQDMFVAVLTHDLRSPLHAISLIAETLIESRAVDEQHAPLVLRTTRSVTRMTRMIDNMLDFTHSRMGSGLRIKPDHSDLGVVARGAVDEIETTNPRRTFELHTEGDLSGSWDSSRLAQVMANLLGNAVQYGDPQRPIVVSARGAGDEVVLEVRNWGPVIAPADMAGLFGPFKRLKHGAEAAPHTHHLGLGLFITERIVDAHGGTVRVTSDDAGGTCFAVHLPRVR